ncbi:MAG: Fic family protein [Rickettsiales bacterium]|jgi:Fic family protein|nr:Fic family protein [Rickettsiales bacterium]
MFDISKIVITSEMLKLVAEIDEFKGAWQLFGSLAPERLQMLKKIATIESIGSSTRIEGAKLSDREVEQLLFKLDTRSFRSRDEQEIAGYAYVCEEVFQNFENMPLTENVIKQLHIWLLQFSHKDQRHMGEYKKFPNHVEAFDESGKSLGIIFETSSPFETVTQMQELIYWTGQQLEAKSSHPLLIIGIFIVTFLAIHPFQDGNGRLSRILTTFLLLKLGYAYVPYSSLESIIESNKESYYLALRRTQQSLKTGNYDFSPWLMFFLRSLQKQKSHLEEKVSHEKMLNLYLPPLSAKIVVLLSKHGRLTIKDLENITKANRSTLKKHVSNLVKGDHITQHGKGKATWYVAQ